MHSRISNHEHGFSLIEAIVAVGLVATAIGSLAQLFIIATRANLIARELSYATVLARQKMEQLLALRWSMDGHGSRTADLSTDLATTPESPFGGTGLRPSPAESLARNTEGYVDYVDLSGSVSGGSAPPPEAVYTRRWSITPLSDDVEHTLVITVRVERARRESITGSAPAPLAVELTALKTRTVE